MQDYQENIFLWAKAISEAAYVRSPLPTTALKERETQLKRERKEKEKLMSVGMVGNRM